ncbi:MAG: AtpZ/AtpI family protein [Minwuia sp.]|uniref:AtpZ/AtpI family protein n=1 Tax=Minwuia sp. TaxID=2493630 RepID=UPI003A852218
MSDHDGKPGDRLGSLSDRLRAARESGPDGRARDRAEKQERSRADGVAWRISAELVAAFLVCGFIGYWVDEWVGTRPWGLVTGLLLGGGVGIRNVYAVAMRVSREAEARDREGRDR